MAQGRLLSLFEEIALPKCELVHAKLSGHLRHVAFQGETPLCGAKTAERAPDRIVGIGCPGMDADIGDAVKRRDVLDSQFQDGVAEDRIRAGIRNDVSIQSQQIAGPRVAAVRNRI